MKKYSKFYFLVAAVSIVQFSSLEGIAKEHGASTLETTLARGSVLCSTAGYLYSSPEDYKKEGGIAGFDRDFCRGIAAAVFGDTSAVTFTQLVPNNRFKALQEGAVDVLVRSTTWTLKRDTSLGIHFTATNFYDGQGFIAPKSLGIKSLLKLREKGKSAIACVEKETTSSNNIKDYIKDHDLPVTLMEFLAYEELRYAFNTGRCDLYTGDRSFLVEARLKDVPKPDDYLILEDIISKEPLGVAVRDNDAQWFNIVRWVIFATIQAEELGITSKNIEDLRTTGTTAQKRFLGEDPDFGKALGLNNTWAYQVIKSVGNYSEIFERNLGTKTIYNLNRGINDLWTRGGLLYAPPFH